MVRREAAAKLLAVAFSLLAVSMVTIHYASDSGVSVLKQKRSLMDKFQGAKNFVLGVRHAPPPKHTHTPTESGLPAVKIHVYESDHTHPAHTHGAPTTTAAPSADTDPADANTDPAEASTDPAEVNTDPVEVNTDPVEVNTDPVEADTAPANTGAGDGSAGAEAGREGGGDYYVSSFPSFSRKQVGPLSSMGDPVLNMNNKFVRIDDCEENDNCWDKDDKKLANWRDFKQESMSVDGTMRTQLRHAFHIAETNLKACEEAYSFDQKSVDKCQGREARKLCYRYYSLAHACDWSEASRHNKQAGTVYWSKSLKLKACDGESKKAMDEMCKEHDKLPGVEVSHWPWQDWKMNMGRRSFTIDPLFGKALPESP